MKHYDRLHICGTFAVIGGSIIAVIMGIISFVVIILSISTSSGLNVPKEALMPAQLQPFFSLKTSLIFLTYCIFGCFSAVFGYGVARHSINALSKFKRTIWLLMIWLPVSVAYLTRRMLSGFDYMMEESQQLASSVFVGMQYFMGILYSVPFLITLAIMLVVLRKKKTDPLIRSLQEGR